MLDGLGFLAKKNYAKKNAKMGLYAIMEFAFVKMDFVGRIAQNYLA
jgi:hypothetical protein